MAIITLRLSAVKTHVSERPAGCSYCGHPILQRWGNVIKPVRDPHLTEVLVYRYRCTACERTFRHYPEGTTRADQSRRLQQFAAVCWKLGLSLRSVTGVLHAFAIRLCHMSVARDVQSLVESLRRRHAPHKIRALGVDGFYPRVKGHVQPTVVAVDLGTGAPIALAALDEKESGSVAAWLGPLVEEFGVEVIVTDDLAEYDAVVANLNLSHQVCRFHVVRWVHKALCELQSQLSVKWQWVLDRIRSLVTEMSIGGRDELFNLYERLPPERKARRARASPLYRLRQLLLRLSERWEKYCLFQKIAGLPATNNRTEQAIGIWRVRSRSVRGFKTWVGVSQSFWLCAAHSD